MKNKIKNYHIIIVLSVFIIICLGNYVVKRYLAIKSYNNPDMYTYNSYILTLYYEDPEYFNFSEDGECILTVEELLKREDTSGFYVDIINDKYGNDCIGYVIINKDEYDGIDIDSSHICDMIDY